MTANVTTLSSTRLSFATLGLATARHAAALLAAWRQRAADRRQLRDLDNHLLRDIGLSRADLEIEIGKPFWRS